MTLCDNITRPCYTVQVGQDTAWQLTYHLAIWHYDLMTICDTGRIFDDIHAKEVLIAQNLFWKYDKPIWLKPAQTLSILVAFGNMRQPSYLYLCFCVSVQVKQNMFIKINVNLRKTTFLVCLGSTNLRKGAKQHDVQCWKGVFRCFQPLPPPGTLSARLHWQNFPIFQLLIPGTNFVAKPI